MLELNAVKLRTVASEDLQAAKDVGTRSQFLWNLLVAIRKTIKSDAQENEGVNSVIKHVVSRAPSIQLPLVDARVRVKRELWSGRQQGLQIEQGLARDCSSFATMQQTRREQSQTRSVVGNLLPALPTFQPMPNYIGMPHVKIQAVDQRVKKSGQCRTLT